MKQLHPTLHPFLHYVSFHPTQYDVMDCIVDEFEKALKQVSDSLLDEKMEEL